MRIEEFQLERWQSLHEHQVELNLSDSGVHPLSLAGLGLSPADLDAVLHAPLIYSQTNGTPALRGAIAALHDGAGTEHIEVVNGGSEANFIAVWSLVEPGDEVVVMFPTYMQIPGLVRALGGEVTPWWMTPDLGAGRWTVDLDRLEELVTERTKLVAICNPNNPTGVSLTDDELSAIGRIAAAQGAWVLSDEVYRGSELRDGAGETPTIWGRQPRAIVTGSLSKTYGLPGLRLGWIVAPADTCATFWAHHDYTTIGPGVLSDALATHVLTTPNRLRLLERTRQHLRRNVLMVSSWLDGCQDAIRWVAPAAGAMAYLRYASALPSVTVARRLLVEHSLLVVPGAHYQMDGWIRIGFGGDPDQLARGLDRMLELLG